MCFPPCCDMVQLTLSSEDEEKLSRAVEQVTEQAKTLASTGYTDVALSLFGPLEAQVYRAAEQYRMRLIFKCRWNKRTRAYMRELLLFAAGQRGVAASVEINPLHA